MRKLCEDVENVILKQFKHKQTEERIHKEKLLKNWDTGELKYPYRIFQ